MTCGNDPFRMTLSSIQTVTVSQSPSHVECVCVCVKTFWRSKKYHDEYSQTIIDSYVQDDEETTALSAVVGVGDEPGATGLTDTTVQAFTSRGTGH